MAIGPIQLLVIGFNHPDFQGEILDEIERLRESDTIRLIDSLTVVKSADGDVASMRLGNLSEDESIELGSKIGALIGLGYAGEEGAESGAELGAEYAASTDAGVFTEEDAWDVVASIPRDWPRPCCSSSIIGRCHCGTRLAVPVASGSMKASSIPSIWSPSV